MNRKNITTHLNVVINEWIRSLPSGLQKDVRSNVIVTGGSIVSLFLHETPKDYDLYFVDPQVAYRVAQYYAGLAAESGRPVRKIEVQPDTYGNPRVYIYAHSSGYIELPSIPDKKYHPRYITSNAISLTDKIQLIMRFCGNAEMVHKNFDFIHCTNYYTGGELHTNPEAIECILTKELQYRGSLYPLASIIRTRKFIERGWKINAGQYLKMCMQLHNYDLRDIAVLKDQLMGVDASYFYAILSQLKEGKGLINGVIDDTYLFELVNKFF